MILYTFLLFFPHLVSLHVCLCTSLSLGIFLFHPLFVQPLRFIFAQRPIAFSILQHIRIQSRRISRRGNSASCSGTQYTTALVGFSGGEGIEGCVACRPGWTSLRLVVAVRGGRDLVRHFGCVCSVNIGLVRLKDAFLGGIRRETWAWIFSLQGKVALIKTTILSHRMIMWRCCGECYVIILHSHSIHRCPREYGVTKVSIRCWIWRSNQVSMWNMAGSPNPRQVCLFPWDYIICQAHLD